MKLEDLSSFSKNDTIVQGVINSINEKLFNEMIFFHSPDSFEPKELVVSFQKFLKKFQIRGRVIAEYEPGSVEPGKVYFTLDLHFGKSCWIAKVKN